MGVGGQGSRGGGVGWGSEGGGGGWAGQYHLDRPGDPR